MRKPILIASILFFAATLKASAQQENSIKGITLKKANNEPIARVEITDLHNKNVIFTNNLGKFNINAAIGDTLLFARFEFTDQKMVIVSANDLFVYMMPLITLLEVKIHGQTKQQELSNVMQQYRNKGIYFDGRPPITAFSPFGGSPITGFYEFFSEDAKNIRHFAQFSKGELEYSEVRKRYNPTVVKRITNASDSTVAKFMLYYTPSYADIKSWNDYDLIKHVRKSFDYYEKNKNKKGLEELNSPSFIKPTKVPVQLTE